MEREIEVETGEQSYLVTYAIEESENRTLENPGCDGGIEVLSVENSRGEVMDFKADWFEELGELVIQQLQSYAEDVIIENYEQQQL